MLYDGIVIQKAPAGKQVTPLRPSGLKPGAKAPTSMLEAINPASGTQEQQRAEAGFAAGKK
jgi:hypothetical protein